MRFYRGKYQIPRAPRRGMHWVLLMIPAVFCVYLVVAGESGLYQIRYRGQQIKSLEEEIEALKTENADLEREVALLEDDLATIERIARERYGMVKANESVYMVYPKPPVRK